MLSRLRSVYCVRTSDLFGCFAAAPLIFLELCFWLCSLILYSGQDPETEQEIFQEELQLRMQQKLDDKMTEMQDKISANMDTVLNQAVHKFASEMSDLKSMCEEELEKTQQMLHHLTDNQQ